MLEVLINKYEQKLEATKTLLADFRFPITNFHLAKEQAYMEIIKDLKLLNENKK